MRAVVYEGLGRVAMADVPEPEPRSGEVRVAVRASGLCHTDIDILHGRYGSGGFPLIPGHEFSGTVEAVGPDVAGFAEGDHVVCDPNIGCGVCLSCRRGRINLCERLGAYGVTFDGGLAAFSVVAAANLVPAGEMNFELAALGEPMACVLNGIAAAGTDGVERAIIFGAGPIGLLMAVALAQRGVAEVMVVDPDRARLELAEAMGFAAAPPGPQILAQWRHVADLAVDATGLPEVAEGLVEVTASGGRILFFGVCPPEARIGLSPFEVFRRQLTIVGAHSLNRNIPEALQALRAAGPAAERLISHRLPLEDIPGVLRGRGPEGRLKVQAVW